MFEVWERGSCQYERHFEHGGVYKSSVYLAETCGLSISGNKNTVSRPALEPCTEDLVTMMTVLFDSKKLPMTVIASTELGIITLDTVSVSCE